MKPWEWVPVSAADLADLEADCWTGAEMYATTPRLAAALAFDWMRTHSHADGLPLPAFVTVREAGTTETFTFTEKEVSWPQEQDKDCEPRPPGCRCQWEAGDSSCPVHGDAEPAAEEVTQ